MNNSQAQHFQNAHFQNTDIYARLIAQAQAYEAAAYRYYNSTVLYMDSLGDGYARDAERYYAMARNYYKNSAA